MSETRHCLQKMSGSDMQSYMEKQVDGGRWQSGDVHGFHRGSKGSAEFRIIANPTLNQPGDGIIQFRQTGGDYKAPVYDDLRKTIEKPSFQQKRQDWKTKDLSKANFRTKTDKANVMLDFEVARRNDDYLLRSEVEAGIRKAIKSPPKDYPNQVSLRNRCRFQYTKEWV